MVRIGSTGAAISALTIPILFLSGVNSPWAIFAPGILMGFSHGLAMPNAQAGGVSVNPQLAGSASGLMMFLQMSIGAGFGQRNAFGLHELNLAAQLALDRPEVSGPCVVR